MYHAPQTNAARSKSDVAQTIRDHFELITESSPDDTGYELTEIEEITVSSKAIDVTTALDTLSAAEMRSLDTAQLRRFEAMCWHWASLAENELQERRRASREEESE